MALKTVSRVVSSVRVRHFTTNSARFSTSNVAVFSAGEDSSMLRQTLDRITGPAGRWTLTSDGRGIERQFAFKSFKKAWNRCYAIQEFMNHVAGVCKAQRHHPEWSNVYNQVFVRWTTHNPPGLSKKDLKMAEACDRFAAKEEGTDTNISKGATKHTDPCLNDLTRRTGGKASGGEAAQREKDKIEAEEKPDGAAGGLEGIGGQPS